MPTYTSPPPPAGHIERRRLDHHYDRAVGRVLRVVAPAGYGKTSLVSRWVAYDDRAVAWIDVERYHNDPVALLDELRQALVDFVEVPRMSMVHAGTDDACIVALRRAFADVPPDQVVPFVLVLDDVHRLHHPTVAWMLETFARALPSSSTVVLVGRAHRDHGTMARIALAPGTVDVTIDDLSFDESESDQLFDSFGIPLDRSERARIIALTDGWPAGVALTAHAIRSGAQPPEAADDIAIIDYFRSEWMSHLEPDDLTFLCEVSPLRRFTGSMCDEVLGRTGSATVIRRLHRDQTVVFPLDRRDHWYRLHPLLARWLSTDLEESDPGRWVEIQRNASSYWERTGDIDRAVEHAHMARDLALEERLVATYGGAYFPRGRHATVSGWLEAFPGERIRTSPGLSALRCLLAMHQGDGRGVAQWLHVHDEATAITGSADSVMWTNVLHAAFDERQAADLIPLAEEACQKLGDGPWAPFGFLALGGLRFLDGDVEAALDSLDSGILRAELSDTPMLRVHCLAMSSVILDCTGDSTAADEACASAELLIAERRLNLTPVTAPTIAALALSRARHERFVDARMHIEAARRSLAGFSTVAPWFNVAARISLVRAALLLDDQTTSAEVLREAEHHARFEPVSCSDTARSAVACLHALRDRVESMHRPATGASALTEAEIRVVHHLSSNLSLSDIAGLLFLSRNTVKSHAASIYRKLGAQNRREAVELATAAGLLEQAQGLIRRT